MKITQSHKRFRKYLEDCGYRFDDNESQFHEDKKLDLVVFSKDDLSVLVEIKGLQEGGFWKELREKGLRVAWRSSTKAYRQVRHQLSEAFDQIECYRCYPNPRVVVIVREEGFHHLDNLSRQEILLGDLQWVFTINNKTGDCVEKEQLAGDHGAIAINGVFDHPYISAVCFLIGDGTTDTLFVYHTPVADISLPVPVFPRQAVHYIFTGRAYKEVTA